MGLGDTKLGRQGLTKHWNIRWPEVSDLSSAERAIKQAFWAAIFVASVTAAVAIVALFLQKPILGMDGWGLVDASFFAAIAFGLNRKSRFAAIVGLALYVAEHVYAIATSPRENAFGVWTALIFSLLFIHGIRGTFAYRRLTPKTTDTAVESPTGNQARFWRTALTFILMGLLALTTSLMRVWMTASVLALIGMFILYEQKREKPETARRISLWFLAALIGLLFLFTAQGLSRIGLGQRAPMWPFAIVALLAVGMLARRANTIVPCK